VLGDDTVWIVYRYQSFGGACCLHLVIGPRRDLALLSWSTPKMEAANFSETVEVDTFRHGFKFQKTGNFTCIVA
jgi:hypothetical protein